MNAFLPGFEQRSASVQREAISSCRGASGQRGNFPVSNRKTPDDLGSTDAISGFKPGVVKRYGTSEPPSVRAVDFRVQAFARSLSRQERAAVAARRRFYSLPWIVPAGQDDTDEIP